MNAAQRVWLRGSLITAHIGRLKGQEAMFIRCTFSVTYCREVRSSAWPRQTFKTGLLPRMHCLQQLCACSGHCTWPTTIFVTNGNLHARRHTNTPVRMCTPWLPSVGSPFGCIDEEACCLAQVASNGIGGQQSLCTMLPASVGASIGAASSLAN